MIIFAENSLPKTSKDKIYYGYAQFPSDSIQSASQTSHQYNNEDCQVLHSNKAYIRHYELSYFYFCRFSLYAILIWIYAWRVLYKRFPNLQKLFWRNTPFGIAVTDILHTNDTTYHSLSGNLLPKEF